MKTLRFLAVFLIILLVSAYLAPWIYQLTHYKFERILSRLVMVLSLTALLIFVRKDLKNLFRYGLEWDENRSPGSLLRGVGIGVFTLAFLTAVEVLLGGRSFIPRWAGWVPVVAKTVQYTFSALLVGFLEETLFRGWCYSTLKKRFSMWGSLFATNGIYAILHFFKGGKYPVPQDPAFSDSVRVMLHLLDPLRSPLELLPTFFGLLLFGLILSFCYLRTGSLYFSIGLHAGCVFFLKIDNWFIQSVPQASPLIFGDKNLYSGAIGFSFFVLLFFFLKKFLSGGSFSGKR